MHELINGGVKGMSERSELIPSLYCIVINRQRNFPIYICIYMYICIYYATTLLITCILILHLSVCDVRAGGHRKPFDLSFKKHKNISFSSSLDLDDT